MRRGLSALHAAFLFAVVSVFTIAEDVSQDLSLLVEFETLVMESNRELAALKEQLQELQDTVSHVLQLGNSSLSVSGGYSYHSASPESAHAVSGSASVAVPILPQISMSAQLDTSGNASLSLVFTPLAGLGGDAATEQQLATLGLTVIHQELQLRWQSRTSLLNYMAAKLRLAVRADILETRRRHYEQVRKWFQAGFNSSTDLQNAADQLASDSVNHIGALQQKSEAEKNLYLLVGRSDLPEEILSFGATTEHLLELISDAVAVHAEIADFMVFTSLNQQAMLIQKSYLERQLSDTWILEPAVSVSVSGSVSGASGSLTGSAGANVSLQLSVADINIDEIQDLQDQIADLERDLQLEQVTLNIDEQNTKRSLEAAKLSAEIAARNLDSMRMALDQASRDLEREIIPEFEYEDVRQNRDLAEVNYLTSLIAVYGQLGMLLRSYSDMEL